MEDISVLQRPVTSTFNNVRTKISSDTFKNTLAPNNFVGEVDENFINYLNWHGLANEDNLLVLSSKLHYYYDYEELREVKTLINLKKINLIKHLDDFLHTLCYGLSPKANFIGCFSDRKTQKGVSLISRLYKKFINFLDSRIEVDIDSKDFSKLLESYGFKIIDMTEINGLTYFRSQNYRRSNI